MVSPIILQRVTVAGSARGNGADNGDMVLWVSNNNTLRI